MTSNQSSAVSEDDIIKRRLMYEGDSGTDDKQVNKILRYFVKWCNSISLGGTNGVMNENGSTKQPEDEDATNLEEQMMASLSHVEFNLLRNQFIYGMNKSEQSNYEVLYEKIKREIERAKSKIIENKFDLQQARKIRKNRQEYDVLAKQIMNYPDRAEMQVTIKRLEEKVESLKKVEAEYYKKFDLRRKQFSVVLQSLSALKNLIDNDAKLEDILNTQLAADLECEASIKKAKRLMAARKELIDDEMKTIMTDDDDDDDDDDTDSEIKSKKTHHISKLTSNNNTNTNSQNQNYEDDNDNDDDKSSMGETSTKVRQDERGLSADVNTTDSVADLTPQRSATPKDEPMAMEES